jgi:hypothetical protein
MTTTHSLADLGDRPLLEEAKRLAADERQATVALLRALSEIDSRRLYLGEGCASMFTYCTHVLHLSEGGAYNRIEACRAARRYPVIFDHDCNPLSTPDPLCCGDLIERNPLDVVRFNADHRLEAGPVAVGLASVTPAVDEAFIVYRAYVHCLHCTIAERDADPSPRARREALLDLVVSHGQLVYLVVDDLCILCRSSVLAEQSSPATVFFARPLHGQQP